MGILFQIEGLQALVAAKYQTESCTVCTLAIFTLPCHLCPPLQSVFNFHPGKVLNLEGILICSL